MGLGFGTCFVSAPDLVVPVFCFWQQFFASGRLVSDAMVMMAIVVESLLACPDLQIWTISRHVSAVVPKCHFGALHLVPCAKPAKHAHSPIVLYDSSIWHPGIHLASG